MEDLERYADYNDTEEDQPHGRRPLLLLLKILVALVCLLVIGVLAFRLVLFSHYPDGVTRLLYNDTLTAYYQQTGGNMGVKTQTLRYPYDDAKDGNFFCNALAVIPGAQQLQITLRYNTSTVYRLGELYGIEDVDPDDPELFTYQLVDNYGRVYAGPSASSTASRAMYRYRRLVFDGVDLAVAEPPEWIRLEIFVQGHSTDKPYAMVLVYENHEDFSTFTDYVLAEGEVPPS